MTTEDTLIETRKAKHLEANNKTYPLASSTLTIASVIDWMDNNELVVSIDPKELTEETCIHGRLVSFRKNGAITFLKLKDDSGTLQIIAVKSAFEKYDTLHLIDLGDILEIKGKPCLSKTGEKSILLSEFTILTKAYRPPPEKWNGLSNVETKYRKRYLDLMSSDESKARFVVHSLILKAIRAYLDGNGFIEVETSILNTISSGANAKPFTTHHNVLDMDLFLRVAPELYLKRLLVGGFEKVYELGKCFRNEGLSTRHNPEFTMLEFYQAYGKFDQLLTYAVSLLNYVSSFVELNIPKQYLDIYSKWNNEKTYSFNKDDFKKVTMWNAIINGVNKAGLSTYEEYSKFIILNEEGREDRRKKINFELLEKELKETSSYGSRLAIWFEHIAEPFLTEDYRSLDGTKSAPVIITDYPKEICPLARQNDEKPNICDRFELYVDGKELCNAFQELNNPEEQALRFKEQLETNQKDPMLLDQDYIEALETGLPPTIGFGLGVSRLSMLLTNAESIKDVILFPTMKSNVI